MPLLSITFLDDLLLDCAYIFVGGRHAFSLTTILWHIFTLGLQVDFSAELLETLSVKTNS